MTAATIERKIKGKVGQRGCYCSFHKISKRRGVKVFTEKRRRDFCFRFQSLLHEYGLAPKAYKMIDLTRAWAYTTEIAEIITDTVNSNGFVSVSDSLEYEYSEHVYQLDEALGTLGISYRDLHVGNVGYLGRAMVLIDCDPAYANSCNGLLHLLDELF